MRRLHKLGFNWLCLLWAQAAIAGASLPTGWQFGQPFTVPASGLVKINLPVETLGSARPGLQDLRLYDESGNEVSYWIEHPPAPIRRVRQQARNWQTVMNARSTVVTLETGTDRPVDGVLLESPAIEFIKPVKIEGSVDGRRWQSLADGLPIFRQANGAAQLHVSFPAGTWPRLRLTLDDIRSAPIALTGAMIDIAPASPEPNPVEWLSSSIVERNENPGETRLMINLGAPNLDLASIQIVTDATLFARRVTLATTQVANDSVREQSVAEGLIFRVALESAPVSENLLVPMDAQVPSKQLIVLIHNGDSPPLSIISIRVGRRPVHLLFFARQPGVFHLLTGNSLCAAPAYDLGALNIDPRTVPLSTAAIPPPMANQNYKTPEVLPGVASEGALLDVSDWNFRRPVKIDHAGAQQLELDLPALAHAQSGLQDLRLLCEGRQIPFIVEYTSLTRTLPVSAAVSNDTKDPGLTRWTIRLPGSGWPVQQLACTAPAALFQREMTLYQMIDDERGAESRQVLASGTWTQTPDHTNRDFILSLNDRPRRDTIFLETHNGDNPPIELKDFRGFYSPPRLLFKARTGQPIFLYYGNAQAQPPRYDLALVGDQLVMASKSAAALAPEEMLKKIASLGKSGSGGLIFWCVLGAVVVVLLWLIAKLLPASQPEKK